MEIKKIPISKINPAPYNPRKDLQPGDPEYKQLQRSINEFGLVEPLVWNERTGNLVGGHQRFKVLVTKGLKEVEVSVVDLPLEKEKALNLALNKIQGSWDQEKLALLLDELSKIPDFDVGLTGFDLPEISNILDNYFETNEDDFDFEATLNSIKEPVTKRGDLIILGKHRLLCGDSSNHEDIKKLMSEHKAQLLFTDPPFNVNYRNNRPSRSQKRRKKPKWEKIYKDDLPQEEYEKWLEQVLINIKEYLVPGAPIYIWNGHRQFGPMYLMLLKHGFQIGSVIVWAKEHFALSYSDYNQEVEFCLYGWKKNPKGGHFWYGPYNETTLWQVKRDPAKNLIHPTQKPITLAQRAIRNSSKRDDLVVDLFAGSGSTLIAAESLNRRCFTIEIDPRYCDAIVKRYISYVGKDKVSQEIVNRYMNS